MDKHDYLQIFNVICEILYTTTHVPLDFNKLYSSQIKCNFVGVMSTETICEQCKVA